MTCVLSVGGQGSAEVAVTVMTAVAAVAADADNLTSPFDAVSLSGESDRTGALTPHICIC